MDSPTNLEGGNTWVAPLKTNKEQAGEPPQVLGR